MAEVERDGAAMSEGERGLDGAALVAGSSQACSLPPNGRWSTRRKQEVVLRMLSGESIDSLSRESGVEQYRLEEWRDKALAAMEAGLKEREGGPLKAELR